jgi:hypothetical protein
MPNLIRTPDYPDVVAESQPTATSEIGVSSVNVGLLARWAEAGSMPFVRPDMEEVLCVFSKRPIREHAFVYLRRRSGGDKCIVLALTEVVRGCEHYEALFGESGPYEVVKVRKSAAIGTFYNACKAMRRMKTPVFSLAPPAPAPQAPKAPKPPKRRPEPLRTSARRFALAGG